MVVYLHPAKWVVTFAETPETMPEARRRVDVNFMVKMLFFWLWKSCDVWCVVEGMDEAEVIANAQGRGS